MPELFELLREHLPPVALLDMESCGVGECAAVEACGACHQYRRKVWRILNRKGRAALAQCVKILTVDAGLPDVNRRAVR